MTVPLSLGSRVVERPRDDGWTLVGTLDGTEPALVDGAGLVNPGGADCSIDWWIGADDRWYLPSREPSVRQRRLGAGPVIETTVRIPSGDARQLVYGAHLDGREVIVVEVHNDSPVPVALAIAVRPYAVDGRTAPDPITMSLDDRVVRVGTSPTLVLPRPPNESGGTASADLVDAVRAGEPLGWDREPSSCGGRGANAVLLHPLPHRTSLRFLVPAPSTDVSAAASLDPGSAPEADAVARGWTSVVEAAGRLGFPDSHLSALVSGARARLLLASGDLPASVAALCPDAGAVLHGLALGGHGRELGPVLDAFAATFPTELGHGPEAAAEIVAGLAAALVALDDQPGPELVETAAQVTYLIERSKSAQALAAAKWGLAEVARLAGDETAAQHLRRGLFPPPVPEPADVTAQAERASSAGAWSSSMPPSGLGLEASPVGAWAPVRSCGDDAGRAGRFVTAARSLLIDDSGPDLVILRRFPTEWRGGNVEVHRMPTRHGELSYGVRWHGPRPALLWQLDRASASIRCPGLDPDWSTSDERGETLLAGTADGLAATPAPGESFS